jgi:maltooligosyltrehalose trehalohydrolase
MPESAASAPATLMFRSTVVRRLPVGAEPIGDRTTHFRVWAPRATQVSVESAGAAVFLDPEPGGYFSGLAEIGAGFRYGLRLDGRQHLYPDPASRFQPDGPHGLSAIVDPRAYAWQDQAWPGVKVEGQVIYEMHVGTFTREGTWRAAAQELPELAAAGVTLVEMMPIAEFEGRFGWGYDGVDLFAPAHLYGTPDGLRHFVDTAHAAGIGVILDVVYNHLGPVGNYLPSFSTSYFTDRYENEWGQAINFDGADSAPVRDFFLANAGYWIDEFHFDGLRLDATQQIFDSSSEHIVRAIGLKVRQAAQGRATIVIAENEPQDSKLIRPVPDGGYGLDAVWNDDFHHSAMVALTGHGEAYYSDTAGTPQELISVAKYGYLFQGQPYDWQKNTRGTPTFGLPGQRFVNFLQNHDQVANSARGLRGDRLTSPGRWRTMTAFLLLIPGTPLFFQGEEFASSAPFLYFADFEAELATGVRNGRAQFLLQFKTLVDFTARAELDDPGDPRTFERCKLDLSERDKHALAYALHRDLLALRRRMADLRAPEPGNVDGAVLATSALLLRFFGRRSSDDRLLILNLGSDLHRPSIAEPLIAPPAETKWHVTWSSEDPRYGGSGTPEIWEQGRWRIPGESALVFEPTTLKSEGTR